MPSTGQAGASMYSQLLGEKQEDQKFRVISRYMEFLDSLGYESLKKMLRIKQSKT